MPHDLDDYEIRRDEDELATLRASRPRRGGIGLLLAIAAVAVIVAGGVAAFLLLRRSAAPENTAPPEAPASAAAPAGTPGAAVPSLQDSDEFARGLAGALSSHPELARWLAQTSLIRTLTAVVDQIANGETPRLLLDFLAPKQRFRGIAGPRKRTVADPASHAAYDTFADVIASIDAAAAARAYRTAEPLFDAAYRELGTTGGFRGALDQAIAHMLAVPVLPAEAELVSHTSGFRWADPKVEALNAAQKQLLRTGPRNVQLVQAKLRELQTALANP